MKKSKGAKAIEEVARKNGMSVMEARREIELAISEAMANPNPAARALWDKYFPKGKKPTPEEFIVYLAKKIKSDGQP